MNPQVMQVVVRGRLSPELVAALSEFEISTGPDGRTSVVGVIPDQAKLIGLLDLLDQFHIEVLSVNPVPAA